MNVHISYRLHKSPAVEKDIQHQIEKLQKRLHVFRPELIHLKGSVEENPHEGATVSLNLRLPSGQMAVQESAPAAITAVKNAFEDLLHQLNRHKELLRASHKWKRRGHETSERQPVPQVPFEDTLASVHPSAVSAEDVRSYVNINLSRLERFVEREIYMREVQELIVSGSLSKEEVIDEAIASVLDNSQEKPERLSLEPWLYHLALRALDELSRPDESNGNAVHLEDSARPRNVKASDEPELQFHQPDESITGETVIADDRVATPEQIMASDETLLLIASALRDVRPRARQAFILYAIEGFAVEEISAITGLAPDNVLASIAAARDHLRKAPGLSRQSSTSSPGTGFASSGAA